MKRISFLVAGILISGHLAAQQITFKKRTLSFRTSYERLKMNGEPDLGMVGIGADLFFVDRLPNFYLTLNSYSAILGTRPGLITFGTGAGYVQPLFRSRFSLDAGLFVGGGGGGGAPDGGGLITRGHFNLSYNWKNVSVFGGYSRLDFPTGDMGSNNLNLGIAITSVFHTVHRSSEIPNEHLNERNARHGKHPPLKKSKIRATLVGLRYVGFADSPTMSTQYPELSGAPLRSPDSGEGAIHLIGIELDKFFHEKWYAALKLHGAVAGGIDGYMSYLIGLGFEQPLGTPYLRMDAQLLAGPSGGGGVASGGGGTLQAAVALRARLGNTHELKASLGQTVAPGGSLNGTFLELGFSKSFHFLAPEGRGAERTPYLMKPDEQLHHFGMELKNRTYFSAPDLPDKNGVPYERSFNLLGFQLSKRINGNLNLLGATYWAYQGSYGAYAEGLVGLGYRYPFASGWNLRAQVLGGAAGGGGIDLGNGPVIQYSAGLARALGTNWGIFLEGGQMRGLQGNFKPYFLDVGLIYRFSQLSR